MSEHIHDWNVQIFQFAYGNPPAAECYVCHAELSEDEVNRRLNAVEQLSAEDALHFANRFDASRFSENEELRAYAAALEK